MGAKTSLLVYADGDAAQALRRNPQLDRDRSAQLVVQLFPKDNLEPISDGDLSNTCPPDDEIHAGCFHGVSIVAAKEFAGDYPSRLAHSFLSHDANQTIYLHAMHSVVDWLAFAKWTGGELQRSLSLSPDSGILEDIGSRLTFETPFWSGQHPVETDDGDPYPFPFHPLELGEAALNTFFGFQLEGFIEPGMLEPESIPLIKFKRKRSRWKFW